MNIGDIYKSKTTHHTVIIYKISFYIHYKYIKSKIKNDHIEPDYDEIHNLSNLLFTECFNYSEKLTNEYIIRGIIE